MCTFFYDITIFYGGNGSGKTTLLNVIAQKLQLARQSLYNRSAFFDDYVRICRFSLTDRDAVKAIRRGCIITSDDVFQRMLRCREDNEGIDRKREELVDQYYSRTHDLYLPRRTVCRSSEKEGKNKGLGGYDDN